MTFDLLPEFKKTTNIVRTGSRHIR